VNVAATAGFFPAAEHDRGNHLVLGSFERVIAMLSFFFVANLHAYVYVNFLFSAERSRRWIAYRAWGYPWTTSIG